MTLLALAVSGRGVVDPSEPVLHADDVAFLRGRAAFETLRVYAGTPFRLEAHLDRLAGSAERVGLPPVERSELEQLVAQALDAAGQDESVLRFFWTGGREGTDQAVALAMVSALPGDLEQMRSRGISLISLQLAVDVDLRARSPWLLGGVKSTSYAVNMAAEAEAVRQGADDAVFLARDTTVLEGPVTNVWWREGSTLFTPALELGILAGVTRSQVLDSAGELGYGVEEGRFPLSQLESAEEAFTSSSVREILPVIELDGHTHGEGRPGPAALAVQEALRRAAYGAAGPIETAR